jgi:hypothetical protein
MNKHRGGQEVHHGKLKGHEKP